MFRKDYDPMFHARFWSLVSVSQKVGDCWKWNGATHPSGYGFLKVGSKNVKSHRVAYCLVFGDFDEKLLICHKCDNPICCNPNHLFCGTQQDNMNDRQAKFRQCFGENHRSAKLTEAQVRDIRKRYKRGVYGGPNSVTAMGKEFGVTKATVYAIANRKRWRHVF